MELMNVVMPGTVRPPWKKDRQNRGLLVKSDFSGLVV